MSWRPSNSFRPSNGSSRTPRSGGPSTLDPTLRMILIGVAAVALVVVVLFVVLSNVNSQSGAQVAVAQPTQAPAPTTAPTATPAPTLVRAAAANAAPAVTINPADAGPAETSGDAEAGRALFASMPPEALTAGAVNCIVCHNIDPGSATLIGPSLSGVGARAATRIEGLSAAQYLRTSITIPDGYVVEPFVPGLMTQTFAKALTPTQVEDLVAYLLTLP